MDLESREVQFRRNLRCELDIFFILLFQEWFIGEELRCNFIGVFREKSGWLYVKFVFRDVDEFVLYE